MSRGSRPAMNTRGLRVVVSQPSRLRPGFSLVFLPMETSFFLRPVDLSRFAVIRFFQSAMYRVCVLWPFTVDFQPKRGESATDAAVSRGGARSR